MGGASIRRILSIVGCPKACLDQLNALLKVLSADKPFPYQIELDDLLVAIQSRNFELYVLEDSEKILGMGSIHFHRTLTKVAAYIEDVAVLEEEHGKGYGKIIVSYLIERAKLRKAKFVELTSNPRRIPATALYQKLGFIIPETNLYRLYF
jgi:ribosomal protein S18 acetylase RimI-like enzyme